MHEKPAPKPVVWIASTKRDLKNLPDAIQDRVGYALWIAQGGKQHPQAKALKGFGDASVIEIIEDWQRDTYRAVYTVRFAEAVYVLHVFQKKSRRGAKTPKPEMAVIEKRLRDATEIHEARTRKKEKR